MTNRNHSGQQDVRIAIGICTYHREHGLRALLDALQRLDFEGQPDRAITIVIIDNSEAATAKASSMAFAERSRFAVHYHNETKKGLANARNAALTEARALGATHLAFVDDDEMPEPAWLEQLFECLEASGVAAAVGPVLPVFETAPPSFLPTSGYATRPKVEGGFAKSAYTGNVMFDMASIDRLGLRFDSHFNDVGGEDTMFFEALHAGGGKIAWAPDAIVHETVSKDRMSAAWLWRRWFRTGQIEAYRSPYPARSLRGRSINAAKGLTRVAVGAGKVIASAIVSGWWNPQRTVASFYTLCRGAGMLANVTGREFKEYKTSNYR